MRKHLLIILLANHRLEKNKGSFYNIYPRDPLRAIFIIGYDSLDVLIPGD